MILFLIHATGDHIITTQSMLDRVISSYILTIRAFDYARKRIERLSSTQTQNILMISMTITPKHNHLPFTEDEINSIRDFVTSSISNITIYVNS